MNGSKRDIAVIILGMVVAGTLTAWLTVVGVTKYLEGKHANDPLARAGGLSDEQKSKR